MDIIYKNNNDLNTNNNLCLNCKRSLLYEYRVDFNHVIKICSDKTCEGYKNNEEIIKFGNLIVENTNSCFLNDINNLNSIEIDDILNSIDSNEINKLSNILKTIYTNYITKKNNTDYLNNTILLGGNDTYESNNTSSDIDNTITDNNETITIKKTSNSSNSDIFSILSSTNDILYESLTYNDIQSINNIDSYIDKINTNINNNTTTTTSTATNSNNNIVSNNEYFDNSSQNFDLDDLFFQSLSDFIDSDNKNIDNYSTEIQQPIVCDFDNTAINLIEPKKITQSLITHVDTINDKQLISTYTISGSPNSCIEIKKPYNKNNTINNLELKNNGSDYSQNDLITMEKDVRNPESRKLINEITFSSNHEEDYLLPWEKPKRRKMMFPGQQDISKSSQTLSTIAKTTITQSVTNLINKSRTSTPITKNKLSDKVKEQKIILKEKGTVLKNALIEESQLLNSLKPATESKESLFPLKTGYKDLVLSVLKKKTVHTS